MKTLGPMTAILVVFVAGCAFPRAENAPRWEYMTFNSFDCHIKAGAQMEEQGGPVGDVVTQAQRLHKASRSLVVKELNALGEKGWAVCSQDKGVYLLRRRK